MAYFNAGFSSHIGKRPNNEDACLVATRTGDPKAGPDRPGVEYIEPASPFDLVAVVGDGMGGGAHGEIASRVLVESVRELFVRGQYQEWVRSHGVGSYDQLGILREFLRFVNSQLIQLANRKGVDRMGTTADLLVVREGRYYYAHAGDSRIYYAPDGLAFRQLTADHNIGQYAAAHGIPNKMVRKKNMVTSILGGSSALQVDVDSGPVQEGGIFILSTDGLDRIGLDDYTANIRRFVGRWMTAAEELAGRAVVRRDQGADNATLVIVECTGDRRIKAEEVMPGAVHVPEPEVLIEVEEFTQTSLHELWDEFGSHASRRKVHIGIWMAVAGALALVIIAGAGIALVLYKKRQPVDRPTTTNSVPSQLTQESQPAEPVPPTGSLSLNSYSTMDYSKARDNLYTNISFFNRELVGVSSNLTRWLSSVDTGRWAEVQAAHTNAMALQGSWSMNYTVPLENLIRTNLFLVQYYDAKHQVNAAEGIDPPADPKEMTDWVNFFLSDGTNRLARLLERSHERLLTFGVDYSNRWRAVRQGIQTNLTLLRDDLMPTAAKMRQGLAKIYTNEMHGLKHPAFTMNPDEQAKTTRREYYTLFASLSNLWREASAYTGVLGRITGEIPISHDGWERLEAAERDVKPPMDFQSVMTGYSGQLDGLKRSVASAIETRSREPLFLQTNRTDGLSTAGTNLSEAWRVALEELEAGLNGLGISPSRLSSAQVQEAVNLWNEKWELLQNLESSTAPEPLRQRLKQAKARVEVWRLLDEMLKFMEANGTGRDKSLTEQVRDTTDLPGTHQNYLDPLARLMEEVAESYEGVGAERGHRFVAVRVESGDTLSMLAERAFGTKFPADKNRISRWETQVLKRNKLSKPKDLRADTTVYIPVWRPRSEKIDTLEINTLRDIQQDRVTIHKTPEGALVYNVVMKGLFWIQEQGAVLFERTELMRELSKPLRRENPPTILRE